MKSLRRTVRPICSIAVITSHSSMCPLLSESNGLADIARYVTDLIYL
jgi:hypothetical protein